MLSLVLPERCIHCGRQTIASSVVRIFSSKTLANYLCSFCNDLLERMPAPDSKLMLERALPLVLAGNIVCVRARVYFLKDSITQSIVHAFKYGDMPKLARVIGVATATKLVGQAHRFDIIVSVPLHRTREAERGFNQSEEFARGIGTRLKVPVISSNVIRRIRPTQSQAQLSISERLENVQGAFRRTKNADRLIRNKRILLIDDVLTTGSTLSAVASELELAQPKSIDVMVFAAAIG